jgi:CubicO group peptidase (beta-lactamase class C family)
MSLGRAPSRRGALQALAALASPLPALAQDLVWPAAQWAQDDPNSGGWNRQRLAEADEHARSVGSDAVLVLHRGRVVHEYGNTRKPCNLYSGRKSVLSVLMGMAHDAGQLKLGATLAELSLDDKQALSATEKTATVQQLLQSRSGVYHPAAYEMLSAKLERPARGSHAPGTHWYYNNWDFNTLGAIYQQATGLDVFAGLEQKLAGPLQMEHFRRAEHTKWELESASRYPAYVMQLSARDFARIGLLMARGGLWQGQRLLSESWVAESTRSYSDVPPGFNGYGYLWWVPLRSFGFWKRQPGDVFFASGNHGQVLWVDRARDIVVAHGTDHTRWLRASPDLGQIAPVLERIFAAQPVA